MIRMPRGPVRYVSLLALVAATLLAPAAPANANPVANLSCTITVTTDINPAVTPQLQTRAATSHGSTGTADCTGTVDGQAVTGPGTLALSAQSFGNCTSADGSASFILKVPTANGIRTIAGGYDFQGNPLTLTGDLTGTTRITGANGDCVNTPITQTTQVLTVTMP